MNNPLEFKIVSLKIKPSLKTFDCAGWTMGKGKIEHYFGNRFFYKMYQCEKNEALATNSRRRKYWNGQIQKYARMFSKSIKNT